MARIDLRTFDRKCLNEIRELRKIRCISQSVKGGDNYRQFWSELEYILRNRGSFKVDEWKRLENEFVLGEVWTQPIGNYYHPHTVHEYSYLYVESEGVAVAKHCHNRPIHNGKHIQKVREWYIFPDGRIEMCDKDEEHELVNDYGHPIYVISVKISGMGR